MLLIITNIYFNGGVNTHYPDLSGKIVIITGANTGIGYYSALEIAKLNPKKVILACRNPIKAEKAIKRIKLETNLDNMEYIHLDLSDMKSI